MKIIEKIFDATTGETIVNERDMEKAELDAFNRTIKENEERAKIEADLAVKRKVAEDKLAALGLTADDLKVLGLG